MTTSQFGETFNLKGKTCSYSLRHDFAEWSKRNTQCFRCGYLAEKTEDGESYDLTGDKAICQITKCNCPAWCVWDHGMMHLGGYKCVHHVREIWEKTIENVAKGLSELPTECIEGESN